MHALYCSALNGGKASDWSRPFPYQREGNELPKGPYQSSNGYSNGVRLPEYFACIPSSRREARSRKFTGKGGRLCRTLHIFNIWGSNGVNSLYLEIWMFL